MSDSTSKYKYGSLHLHIAMRGFVSYKHIRHLWRSAVQSEYKDGDYEGANIDASARKRKGMKKCHYSPSSIAMYISKYITKDIDNEFFEANKRRYWSSKGLEPPPKKTMYSVPSTSIQILRGIFEDITGMDIKKIFSPDMKPGSPPIIWMSTR